jgi:SAM-dependent methyltransferase
MRPNELDHTLHKMRQDWDERARENARFYVNTERTDWTEEEYYASGELTVAEEILTDLQNICQGKDPRRMKVLEIGCGTGRVTRALAQVFGSVWAVDVSGEMIEQARQALKDYPNAHVLQNNGMDLAVIPESDFDFAFSIIVFQHIPSYEVIENYVAEVRRLLRPGALFKFQVQGGGEMATPAAEPPAVDPDDTWEGVSYTSEMARALAERNGFELRYEHGAGEQYYWLWLFKK